MLWGGACHAWQLLVDGGMYGGGTVGGSGCGCGRPRLQGLLHHSRHASNCRAVRQWRALVKERAWQHIALASRASRRGGRQCPPTVSRAHNWPCWPQHPGAHSLRAGPCPAGRRPQSPPHPPGCWAPRHPAPPSGPAHRAQRAAAQQGRGRRGRGVRQVRVAGEGETGAGGAATGACRLGPCALAEARPNQRCLRRGVPPTLLARHAAGHRPAHLLHQARVLVQAGVRAVERLAARQACGGRGGATRRERRELGCHVGQWPHAQVSLPGPAAPSRLVRAGAHRAGASK